MLSPGPWAAERGTAGRWAYRLPATPFALVSRDGRETSAWGSREVREEMLFETAGEEGR